MSGSVIRKKGNHLKDSIKGHAFLDQKTLFMNQHDGWIQSMSKNIDFISEHWEGENSKIFHTTGKKTENIWKLWNPNDFAWIYQ